MSEYKLKVGDLVELDIIAYDRYSSCYHNDVGIVTEEQDNSSVIVYWQNCLNTESGCQQFILGKWKSD